MTTQPPYEKASILIGLCEKALPALQDRAVVGRAQAAIREMKCWSPVEKVSGHPLGDLLMNDNEEGLAADQMEAGNADARKALALLCYAAAYVSWHMSQQCEERPHNMVTEVTEETFDLALTEAEQLGLLDR